MDQGNERPSSDQGETTNTGNTEQPTPAPQTGEPQPQGDGDQGAADSRPADETTDTE